MIVMAGTNSPGGIAQVITGYARDGIFEKWDIRWVRTHGDGNLIKKLMVAATGLCKVVFWMACGRVVLVHAHAAMRGSFWRKSLLVMACRLFKVPVVIHLHGSQMKEFYSSQSRIGQWCIRSTLQNADRVLVLSAGWAQYVRSVAPAARLTILPNYSIPVRNPGAAMARTNRPPRFVFLFLGALVDRKGIYDLLPAFARLTQDDPDVELWMGGTGETEQVQLVMQGTGQSNIRLLGWVEQKEKDELLLSANAFILPSKNENLPMAIIEAMSASLPIVTTNVGGIPEMLVDGRDGLLVDPGRPDQLYLAMRRIRNHPVEAQRMARNAFLRYEAEFSPKVGLPQIDAVYASFGSAVSGRSSV